MRSNPLFLRAENAAFAKNLAFDEGTIRTRPDIVHRDLGLQGQFQGGNYFTPSMGLSATSYSEEPTALVNVVAGKVSMNPIAESGIQKPITLDGATFKGDTYTFGSENYLIVVNKNSPTYWWEQGTTLTESPGIGEHSDENSHDTLDDNDIRHWLPANSTIGHYVHGRNHLSVDFNGVGLSIALNSELYVSDQLTKRGPDISNDILKMEEACLDSMGGTLVSPSEFGKTVALITLPSGSEDGEGTLVDFRECGVRTHNTLEQPRETIYDPDSDRLIQQGWDEKRISTTRLRSVSAVARYAAYQLLDDIWFRSEEGFHFLKKTLGQGTLKDETLNHESHDIQPLIEIDEDSDLSGASVGHWVKGNRFMGTVGFRTSRMHSSSSMGRGIAVMNQATTFTEDDTPRPQWEGVWVADDEIFGIHKFTRGGYRPKNKSFGFLSSDKSARLFFSEFQKKSTGCDVRGGESYPVEWSYVSGAFTMTGIRNIDTIRSGNIDVVVSESTGPIEIQIRTDQHDCWETWYVLDSQKPSKTLISKSFGEPPKKTREATWFQFRIIGSGYAEIRTFDVDAVKIVEKDDGRNECVPLCSEEENYF